MLSVSPWLVLGRRQTGAGKGRQVAGILLDNWLKGRRRAIWISKSDKRSRMRSAIGRRSAWSGCS